MSEDKPCWSRRGFLKTAAGAAAAVSLAPVVGSGCASIPSERFKAGEAESFEGVTRLEDADIYVLQSEKGYAALSAECTHMGCAVDRTEGGNFECPCHGSVFGADGTVLTGPAESPLQWFPVTVEDGKVYVDPTRTVPVGTFTQA